MPEYLAPGVYIEEVSFRSHSIEGVSTSTAAFIGVSRNPKVVCGITSVADFKRSAPADSSAYLSGAVRGFFDNGGQRCAIAWIAPDGPIGTALEGLSRESVSILCCPDEHVFPNAADTMVAHCERRKNCFCILQAPQPVVPHSVHKPSVSSSYAAYYHPWLTIADGAGGQMIPPCGHVAGVYARTDIQRGVWKAPAGAEIHGATSVSQDVSAADADLLVTRGIDVLRTEPARGIVVWAARTTSKDPEWRYVNVRRLLIFIEQSIDAALQWVVFEPDGVALWETVRAAIDHFLLGLWQSGALTGSKPEEAYFVRCDRTTMTHNDIDNGRLIALVGIAPIRPAEFVIFRVTVQSGTSTGEPSDRSKA